MLVQAADAGVGEWTAGGGCEKDDRRMIRASGLPPRPALPWRFGIVAVLAVSVLAYNTRIARGRTLTNLEYAEWVDGQVYSMASWRFWDDMYVAISRYLDWKYGTKRRPGNPDEDVAAVTNVLVSKTGEAGIRPYEFWRTIRDAPFLRVQRQTWIPPLEDPGRPILVAAGFTLLGGVSPYLLIWIGTLASIPALLWILWEARASRVPLAGSLFVALCVSSPFVAESLSLPHSAVAFYLIAPFILIAFGLYAFLGEGGSPRGLLVRASAASLGFAVCCTCRAGALVMAPAFGVAMLVAAGRVCPRRVPGGLVRQCLLAGLLTGVFVAPYLVLRPPQRHNFWISYWEGLGDYGTDRGYSWYDRDLKRWLAARGRKPFEHPRYVSHDDDVYVGQAVRRDILAHPAWFAAVLGRRFVDTVSLAKLGPHGAWDGYAIEPPPLHYKYTTPVDWIGFARWKVEVPIAVLLAGTLLLLSWWALAAGRSRAETKRRLEPRLSLLLALGTATLALPVFMTTAAGMETETYALTHFLGLSLLVDEAWVRMRERHALGFFRYRRAAAAP
jgi:hypothetical protein